MAHTFVVIELILLLLFVDFINSERGKCSPGKFGWKCKFQCACRRGSCDQTTGSCETGCQKGKYGTGCLLDSECMYDTKGINYTGNVGVTKDGQKCIRWMDDFVQREGYTRDRFPPGDNPGKHCRNPKDKYGKYTPTPWCFTTTKGEKPFATCDIKKCACPDGLFGPSCSYVCHCRDVDEACHSVTGTCKSGCADGWTGLNCQKRCQPGKYGHHCQQECRHCYQNLCDPETGNCTNGCEAGYRRLNCSMECQNDYYGWNCEERCGHCREETCKPKTGICFRGCFDGYTGDRCVEKCPAGRYGYKCRQYCGYCKLGTTCDHVTGKCVNGCVAGKMGDTCKEGCPDFFYGENCTIACGKCKDGLPCLKTTGQCMDGCTEGYNGHGCVQAIEAPMESNLTGGIIAAVVIVLVISVVILAIFIFCRNRKISSREHGRHNPLEVCHVYSEIEDKSNGNRYEEIEDLQEDGGMEIRTQTADNPQSCLVPPVYEHLQRRIQCRVLDLTDKDVLYITPEPHSPHLPHSPRESRRSQLNFKQDSLLLTTLENPVYEQV